MKVKLNFVASPPSRLIGPAPSLLLPAECFSRNVTQSIHWGYNPKTLAIFENSHVAIPRFLLGSSHMKSVVATETLSCGTLCSGSRLKLNKGMYGRPQKSLAALSGDDFQEARLARWPTKTEEGKQFPLRLYNLISPSPPNKSQQDIVDIRAPHPASAVTSCGGDIVANRR